MQSICCKTKFSLKAPLYSSKTLLPISICSGGVCDMAPSNPQSSMNNLNADISS